MTPVVIIFMIIAIIFALASLAYVGVDVILELFKRQPEPEKKEEEEPLPPPVVVPVVVEPEPEPEPEPEVLPEVVEHIDAVEADEMISDDLAMKTANYESGAGHGPLGIVNIGLLNERFNAGDTITLAILKEKGIISKKAGRMKILADGILEKPFTIKAESYSIQAIKMIELTGGTVIILKD